MSNYEFNREVHRLFQIAVAETFYSTGSAEVVNTESEDSLHSKFEEFFLLTVSSQEFRVITTIHLNNNAAAKAYVAHKINTTQDALDDECFYDFIGELGNTLCGALKRYLNVFVPSLGMSTPNRLGRECMSHMLSQKPSFESFNNIEINGESLFECAMYICTDAELHFDIKSPTTQATETEAEELDCGELELF